MKCSTFRFRCMKTTQEIRANVGQAADNCYEDIAVKVRASRTARNLPNAWDDFFSTRFRSWKKHRKNQFHCK